jgi:DNA recombination protein RmuC
MTTLLFIMLVIVALFLGIIAYKLFEKREQAIQYLIDPLKEALEKFDAKMSDIEKARTGAYEGLSTQVKSLLETQLQLRRETSNLTNALRKPQVRGRWGEIQLQRVVELAGMLEHCDFYQQQNTNTEEGRLRPDMIIKLPGNKNIVVDAKVPLSSFLDSLEVDDESEQQNRLIDHARLLKEHVKKLSQKNYWDQFKPTPEFVILFLPGETFFSAALEQDPRLIENSINERVIIATPTTLIALLKAIAYGWRQEHMAKNAENISLLGKELTKRFSDMVSHFSDLGSKLQKAVESYNKTMGTLETRVMVTARKFEELNHVAVSDPIPSIDLYPRTPKTFEKEENA